MIFLKSKKIVAIVATFSIVFFVSAMFAPIAQAQGACLIYGPTSSQCLQYLASTGVAVTSGAAAGTVNSAIATALQIILYDTVIWPAAQALNAAVVLLIAAGSYNGFGGEQFVDIGWRTVRDVSNMFFVFIMLIIAIGTIVKWPIINYRQQLRRLIIMALIINFSRTIVLLLIDFSQVIMLTFLQAVQNSVQGGAIRLLGLDNVIATANAGTSFVTFLVAAIMTIIAAGVVLALTIVLFTRIITLWMVIIFAPFAFIASVLPQTREYYDKWWKVLGSQLASGPTIAFMLWLIFTLVGGTQSTSIASGFNSVLASIPLVGGLLGGIDLNTFVTYFIGIGLLLATLRMAVGTSQFGGAAAAAVGGFAVGRLTAGTKAAGRYVAFGKSGQGGVVGRAKSGALIATQALARVPVKFADAVNTSTAGDKSVGARVARGLANLNPVTRLARRADRAATVARSRQDEVRRKPEADYIKRLSTDQQLAMLSSDSVTKRVAGLAGEGLSGLASRFGQDSKSAKATGFAGRSLSKLGARAGSAPQRKELVAAITDSLNEKNADGGFAMNDAEVKRAREQLRTSGATEREMWDFDQNTYARGLNSRRYTEDDAEVKSGKRKAGEYVNKEEGERVRDLLVSQEQAGKLNSDWADRDAVTAGALKLKNKSEGQIIAFLKDLNASTKKAILDGYYQSALRLAENPNVNKTDSDEAKQFGKITSVLAKQSPDRAVELVNETGRKDSAGNSLYKKQAEISTVASKVEKDRLNDLVDSNGFEDVVQDIPQQRASEILTDTSVTDETRRKYIRALAAKANERDPSGNLTEAAQTARKRYSALAEGTTTRKPLEAEIASVRSSAISSKDVKTTGNLDELSKHHDSYIKEQSELQAQREIKEAEGKIDEKFKPNDEIRYRDADGKEVSNWKFQKFDPSTGNVKIRPPDATDDSKDIEISLREFRQRNYF